MQPITRFAPEMPSSLAATMPTPRYHAPAFAGHLDLGACKHDLGTDGTFQYVHGSRHSAYVDLPAGWLSVWVVVAGSLQLESADGAGHVARGQVQVWCEGPLRVGSRLSGRWLGLAAPAAVWARALERLPGATQPGLFPVVGACSRDLRRLFVRLGRVLAGTRVPASNPDTLIDGICAELFEQQRDLRERLQRCSGRTLQRRRQTLLRLLRVRRLIERQSEGKPELDRLARSASYSPWHLIRMYRDVFDETPGEHAGRLRLERAWRMVSSSGMPICEITESLGFESQSAFCRAFKQAYGVTTTQARRGSTATDPLRDTPCAA